MAAISPRRSRRGWLEKRGGKKDEELEELEEEMTDTGSSASDAETSCSSVASSFRSVPAPRCWARSGRFQRISSTPLEPIPGTPVAAGASPVAAFRNESVAVVHEVREDDTTDAGLSDAETSCSSVHASDGSMSRSCLCTSARFILVTPQVEDDGPVPYGVIAVERSPLVQSLFEDAPAVAKSLFRPPQPCAPCTASVTLETTASDPAVEAALECARLAALPVKLHVPAHLTQVIPFVVEMPVKKRLPLACSAHPSTVLAAGAADAAMMRRVDQSMPLKKRVTAFFSSSPPASATLVL